MKKFLLLIFISTSLLSFKPISANEKPRITVDCKYGQCQATAKSTGSQCKHCVSKQGDKFCYQHK